MVYGEYKKKDENKKEEEKRKEKELKKLEKLEDKGFAKAFGLIFEKGTDVI